ncbi:MAG: NlpC/P60 family protein [Vicinamibacterales bacterium]
MRLLSRVPLVTVCGLLVVAGGVSCGGGQPATAGAAGAGGVAALPDATGEPPAAAAPAATPPADAAPVASRPLASASVPPPQAPAPIASRDAGPAVSERDVRGKALAWKGVPFRDDGRTRRGIGTPQLVEALARELFGVDLPSKTDDQMKTGKLVNRLDLEPGDLVFFEGRGIGPFRARSVGMFLGRDELVMAVKDRGVQVVRLSDDPWSGTFKTGRRISNPNQQAPEFSAADYGTNRNALLRDVAQAWVGTLYRQGGTTFDGIGNDEFVRSIYEAINDDDLDGNPGQWAKMGKSVKRADLQPGDIILYEAVGIGRLIDRRHAGMYIGNGEFVHAVKGAAVTISRLDEERWRKAYRAARRIEPSADGTPAVAGGGKPARNAYATTAGRTVSDPERKLRDATQPWLGTPYKLGGNTRSGVDCSAFVKAVYQDVYGVQLPRTAEEQERLGRKVDRKDLQPGDLVFFRTKGMGPFFKARHVGVYVGGGEFAQASGRLGVNIAPLSNRYWSRKYEGARRLQPSRAN